MKSKLSAILLISTSIFMIGCCSESVKSYPEGYASCTTYDNGDLSCRKSLAPQLEPDIDTTDIFLPDQPLDNIKITKYHKKPKSGSSVKSSKKTLKMSKKSAK